MRRLNMISSLTILLTAFLSCGSKPQENGGEPDPPQHESQPAVIALTLPEYPLAEVSIDEDSDNISIVLPHGSVPGKTVLELGLTEDTSSVPESGSEVDLSEVFSIFLSKPSGIARKYIVSTSVAPSSETGFKRVVEENFHIIGKIDGNEISFTFPYGTDVSKLSFSVPSDNVLSFVPDISEGLDLSTPKMVRFVAQDGKTYKEFTFSASFYPEEHGVRGIYLPSPSHTSSFGNYDSVCRSLDLMKSLNFNCLFVCAWAATKAAWPSEVLLHNTNYGSASLGNMYASYSGGSSDALKDIISEAHKRDIKVVLWFEYGFMHRTGGVNMEDPLLSVHPDWIGRSSDGSFSNYNNNDFYLNAYDPQVQNFMLDLMAEALERYPDVDGIQGDDRLPAMPRNSGYDEVTKALYLADTGKNVPSNYQDTDWVRWRLDRLNAFAVKMHDRLKAIKPSLLVCFAPNKYPWCEGVLMQDWPQWIRDGAVDLLTVQLYVTASYERDLDTQLAYVKEAGGGNILNPAMILKNGAAILSCDLLSEEFQKNRETQTCGESQFWFDGLLDEDARSMFKAWYHTPVAFPDLLK